MQIISDSEQLNERHTQPLGLKFEKVNFWYWPMQNEINEQKEQNETFEF